MELNDFSQCQLQSIMLGLSLLFFREVINGNLYTRRLLMKTNKIPKWGEKVLSGRLYLIFFNIITGVPRNFFFWGGGADFAKIGKKSPVR